MRNKKALFLASLLLLFPTGAVYAQTDDRAEILSLMERAFEAVNSGNPDDFRAIQLAEGTSISFRPISGGNSGDLEMRLSTNEELLAGETSSGDVERWTSPPTVLIRGPIAVVWGEYEYISGGAFSHCGIDSVDLVKLDGAWKIANWMWTVERTDCPTDPSR